MLVLQLEPPSPFQQGDHVLRTHQPCLSLAAADADVTVVAGTWLSPLSRQLAEVADILVLAQAVWLDFLPLLARRRAAGRPTVVEINDHFAAVPEVNPVAGYWRSTHNQALLLALAHQADGLMFSSQGLRDRFGWLARRPPAPVFANQMATVPPWPRQRWEGRACLEVGWAGSGGHRRDVEAVVPVLRRLAAAHPRLRLAVMGQADLAAAFADWPGGRVRLAPPGDYRQYLDFLGRLHVGLAPLSPTPFNACRSDVKFVEYGSMGLAPLLAEGPTYRQSARDGDTALFFADPEGLGHALGRLLDERGLAERLAHGAWSYVDAHRRQPAQAPARLAFLRGLLPPGQATGPAAAARLLGRALAAHPTEAHRPHRRFWQLVEGATEAALVELLTNEGRPAAARAERLAEVAARAPGDPLPQLMLGRVVQDLDVARAALRRAEALSPGGVEAAYALGVREIEARRPAAARVALARALALAPDLAAAHEALAHLALAAEDRTAAASHLVDALAANPFYRSPARALAAFGPLPAGLPARLAACPPPWRAMEPADAAWVLATVPPARAAGWAEAALAVHPGCLPLAAVAARACLGVGLPQRARRLLAYGRQPAAAGPAHPLAR